MTQAANLAGTGVCKAWVQFAGGASPSINGSFNVSSITRNGTGDYTINFTTALPDINYAVAGGASLNSGVTGFPFVSPFAGGVSPYNFAPTTSSFRIFMTYNGAASSALDPVRGSVVVFGN
jgi:hypothetical protein